MAWIFQRLVWVSLVLTPSLGYGELYDLQGDYNVPQQKEITNRRTILSNRRGGVVKHDATTNSSIRDSVVFPGPTSRSSYEPIITDPECLKTGICEHVPNYPTDRVNEIVKQLEAANYKFNVDKLDIPEVIQRIGSPEEMLPLCKSRETVITPKAVRDINNQWHVVVNQDNRILQGFRVEICASAMSPCSDLVYVASNSYNKTCVQKYQYRRMAVLNDAGNSEEREFKLPSCCSCTIFTISQFKK